jgi:segregation and condensation protein B
LPSGFIVLSSSPRRHDLACGRPRRQPILETGWIRLRGRRKAPGRPVTYGTTEAFMSHFGLDALTDLPGLDELKGAGLMDKSLPAGFTVPVPSDDPALRDDEDPLQPGDLDFGLAPPAERTEE